MTPKLSLIKGQKPPDSRAAGEGGQLDQFLTSSDASLIASLQAQERQRRRLRWSLVILATLLLTAVVMVWNRSFEASRIDMGSADRAQVLVEQGRKLLLEVDPDGALANFRLAVRLAPGTPDSWTALAEYHLYNHQYARAEKLLRKSLALDPNHKLALVSLGEIAWGAGRDSEAESLWHRAGDRNDLARLYLHQGRFAEARSLFPNLRGPELKSDYVRRLVDAAVTGRIPPEVRPYLASRFPASSSENTARGWQLMGEDRPADAVPVFQRAVTEDPGNLTAVNGLGWALFKSGQTRQCRPWFERALKLQPGDAVALNGLASCLKAEGRIDEAVATWKEMCRLYPNPHAGTRHLAWYYYEQKDYAQAATYFAQLLRRYPDDKSAVEALNESIRQMKEMKGTAAEPARLAHP
jgi:tetratricopeptide (TPR) repeat protein